jgi:hypothetical protein
MKQPRRLCEQCRQPFRRPKATARFCSRECLSEHRIMAARQPRPLPLKALVAA